MQTRPHHTSDPAHKPYRAGIRRHSVLNRLGLADGFIGPADFALIRLVSGAVMLAALVWFKQRKIIDLSEASPLSVLGLTTHILGFSFAYQNLDTGTGALILGGVGLSLRR